MKIKTAKMDYEDVLKLPQPEHIKPKRPNKFFRIMLKVLSAADLKKVNFRYTQKGIDKLPKDVPCLYLMNHSSFTDLKIASSVIYPKPFNIVCTSDGFVGKEGFMRMIGCIPTKKFVSDSVLVRDMIYAVKKNDTSVLMYPEASYSFDGTATTLPKSLGKCLKLLSVPVVMIRTHGSFLRDPLYNNLQLRKVDVSAEIEYVLTPDDIAEKSVDELNEILNNLFTFDNFRWQQENKIKIDEPFRADFLNRVLYKCPACGSEGKTVGKGTTLTCKNCGKTYELTEDGFMKATAGKTEFDHIPDWYKWERECVKKELLDGTYKLDTDVEIHMMVNTDCIYDVGLGHLTHTTEGFHLTGCNGKLDYSQKPISSYSLYSDYYWYEIGDMICIGGNDALYYCFPKGEGDIVAKTRLATEELYKITKERKNKALKS